MRFDKDFARDLGVKVFPRIHMRKGPPLEIGLNRFRKAVGWSNLTAA